MSRQLRSDAHETHHAPTSAPGLPAPGRSSLSGSLPVWRKAAAEPVEGGPDPTAGLLRDANGVRADAAARLDGLGGGGGGLPPALQGTFEQSLGLDLSGVRVHTGAASAGAADALGARAFAHGDDIHFGAGQYAPDDPFGQHLIAHEVAHTVQQRGASTAAPQPKLAVSSPADGAELDADRAADAMVAGKSATVGGAGGGVARKPEEGPPTQVLQDPVAVRDRLDVWHQDSIDLAIAVAHYMSTNWTYFLKHTNRAVGEAWTSAVIRTWVGKGVGFAIGKGVTFGKAALIGSAGGPGGVIAGMVIDKLAEAIASAIISGIAGKAPEEEAALDKGAKQLGDQVEISQGYFNKQEVAAVKDLHAVHKDLVLQLKSANDSMAIPNISKHINGEITKLGQQPDPDDRSLGIEMVKRWTLENTSTGAKGIPGTNKATWDAAKKGFVGGDDLTRLWIHQSRKEWRSWGLPDVDAVCDGLMATGATGTLVFGKPADAAACVKRLEPYLLNPISSGQLTHIREGGDCSFLCEPQTQVEYVDNAHSRYVTGWSYQLDFKGKQFPSDKPGKAPVASPSFGTAGPVKKEPLL